MSTLRISNIEAKSVPASATIDEKVKITNSSGDTLVFIDGKTSGITTVGINTTDGNITFDANSNIVVTGIITATRFSGEITPTTLNVSGGVGVGDSIFHIGDDDTQIRFPAVDTITVETGGSERLRINSYGQVGVNTTSPAAQFGIAIDSNNTNPLATGGIALGLKNTNTTDNSWVCMDFNNSVGGIVGRIGAQFKDTSDKDTDLYFATRADGGSLAERLRITSNGDVGIGDNNPNIRLTVVDTGTDNLVRLGRSDGNSHGSHTVNIKASKDFYHNFKMEASTYQLHCYDGSSMNERFRINSNGLITVNRDGVGGRIDATAGDSSIKISDGNGRSSIKVSDPGSGNSYEWELTSAGNFKAPNGKGIDFSATADSSSGSSISETLDDYEQGDLTLTLTGSNGGSANYGYRTGHYTKIGNVCHVSGDIRFNGSWSGSTGDLYVGLPFTAESTGGCVGAGVVSEWNLSGSNYDNIMIKVDNNESIARFTSHTGNNNNTNAFQTNLFGNGRWLKFSFTYQTT